MPMAERGDRIDELLLAAAVDAALEDGARAVPAGGAAAFAAAAGVAAADDTLTPLPGAAISSECIKSASLFRANCCSA